MSDKFEKRLLKSPVWQKSRYLEMEGKFDSLTDGEQDFLLWLAGWDIWTMDQFLSIASKFKK